MCSLGLRAALYGVCSLIIGADRYRPGRECPAWRVAEHAGRVIKYATLITANTQYALAA